MTSSSDKGERKTMKKLMGWLCALLLIVTPVFYALSEEETAVSQNERLAVFYLHATKDNTLIRTARYVILALDAGSERFQ